MTRHTLHNGIVLHELKNPTDGTSWYAEGGAEGMVLVWDESMVPVEVLAYILYDKLCPQRPKPPTLPTPRLEP